MSEELTGQAGLEADAGYTPLIEKPKEDESHANAREAADYLGSKGPVVSDDLEPIKIIDPDTGEEAAPNKTLTLDQAAHLVTKAQTERQAMSDAMSDLALQAEIDSERHDRARVLDWQGRPIEGLNDLLEQPKAKEAPEAEAEAEAQAEAKPEAKPRAETELSKADDVPGEDGLTDNTRAMLRNPQIRETIEHSLAHAERVSSEAAQVMAAALWSQVPELQGMNAQQMAGAIAIMQQQNPQRAAAIVHHLQNVNSLLATRAEAAQQQAEIRQTQVAEWRTEQDRAFHEAIKDIPKPELSKLATEAHAALIEYGMTEAQISELWDSSILRSATAQRILLDAARYRMAKRTAARPSPKPAPRVMKPGMDMGPQPSRGLQREIAALEDKSSLTVKEAAKLLSLKGQRSRGAA